MASLNVARVEGGEEALGEHALGVEGPIREFYIVGSHDTAGQSLWRTEIGWPVFQTASPAGHGVMG